MHPFSPLCRSIPSLGGEQGDALLADPEEALPLLADEDLNHRVAADLGLHLPTTVEPWVHKVGGLTGLYSEKPKSFNPEWKTPSFDNIHLRPDLIQYLQNRVGLNPNEKRRLRLCLPARFYPNKTKYFPLSKGIKNYYPEHTLTHFFHTSNYLWTLWEAGITYLRESEKSASFKGQLYPWEQKQLISHGTKLVHTQPVGISSRTSTSKPLCPRLSGLGLKSGQRSMATSKGSVPGSLRARFCSPSWGPHGQSALCPRRQLNLKQPRNHCLSNPKSQGRKPDPSYSITSATPHHNQSKEGASTNSSYAPGQSHTPPFEHALLEGEVRSSHNCWWKQLQVADPCGDSCLSNILGLIDDWGPCYRHGDHHIRIPRTPRRITGGVFLVDKNPGNRQESRLVVDFSQFSRGDTRVHWPKFAVPNLQSLTNLLSTNMHWLSLDVAAAFYHIPLSSAAMCHLLVGSPGLEGLPTSVPLAHQLFNNNQMFHVHRHCNRSNYLALLLLFKTYGRKLHMLAHPYIMGFRKIPMGVGLSPFLLAQFTSALASLVRRTFPHCMAFTYMDDVVLGAKSPHHLRALHTSVCSLFRDLGIVVNPTKTKWWGKHLHFMGLIISPGGTLPQDKHHQKALKLISSLPVNKPLDWKILQRITGLLGFLAPFTTCGYPALMPLYHAITRRQALKISWPFKNFLYSLYKQPLPVIRQKPAICQVFADATPTGWGLVNHSSAWLRQGRFPRPLPIHCAELIAACLARRWTGARVIGTDNSIVASGKRTSFPWLLGCVANWMLRGTSFCFVPSALNPADAPSRGMLGIPVAPPPLPFRPSTGRTSLFAVSPSVPPHLPDRVHFASPVPTSRDAWRPP
nr:polymerase [Bat hepatitis virus]